MSTAPPRTGIARGTLWIGLSEVVSNGSVAAFSILAARVLEVEAFGLFGTVMLAVTIVQSLTQTGFEQALVQNPSKIEPLLDVAWTWHLLRGVLLTALLVAVAPLVARWYGQPVLWPLLALSSLLLALQGATNVGVVYFSRELHFSRLCLYHSGTALLRLGVGVPAVLLLRNVWALCAEALAGATSRLLLSYLVHGYRPRLRWSWAQARKLIRYGKWITGLAIVWFCVTKADDLFVSKYLGMVALGFFQLAYNIGNLAATHVTHVISKVSFPTYSRLQGQPDRLRKSFLDVLGSTLLVTGPLTIVLWASSPLLVSQVFGAKWQPIIPLVRVLLIAGLLRSFAAVAGALFQATGRPDLDFKMNLPRAALIVGLIWPVCVTWKLIGVCWLVVLANASCLPIWWYGVRHCLGLRWGQVAGACALAMVTSVTLGGALAGGAMLFGAGLPSFGVGLAGWLLLMWLVGRLTRFDLFAALGALRRDLGRGSLPASEVAGYEPDQGRPAGRHDDEQQQPVSLSDDGREQ